MYRSNLLITCVGGWIADVSEYRLTFIMRAGSLNAAPLLPPTSAAARRSGRAF